MKKQANSFTITSLQTSNEKEKQDVARKQMFLQFP
jgi:hypothetical protein